MKCAACQDELPSSARQAAISIFVGGDEYTYTYFACPACGLYTVECYHDAFMGEDAVSVLPPVSAELGARSVALARACPEPWDKYCGCPSHRALYYGVVRDDPPDA